MDSWDEVFPTNAIDEPPEIQYGPVVNEPLCGRSAIARRRVVGGSEAGFGVYPWQALLQIGTSRCGGALVGRQHVITAGHCVHSMAKKFGEFPPTGIRVYLGEYSLYADVEPLPRQAYSVNRIYMHPFYEFTPQADRFDVAILKLSRPVLYEAHISPICLPEKGRDLEEGTVAMVSGWGATEADSAKRPKELQVADVKVVSGKKCEKWHLGNDIDVS
jgi:secreted trypsin-like serine protease